MGSYKRHNNTRKVVPWKGWGKISPNDREKTIMWKKCGKKCFLGTKKRTNKHPSFPICAKNTCKVNKKGLWAAYIRAKQSGTTKKGYGKRRPTSTKRKQYSRIARKSKRMLDGK